MEKISHVTLSSTLLIPMSAFCSQENFRWIDTFQAGGENMNNNIHIIVFKTDKKEEIKQLLEKDLTALQSLPETQRDNVYKNNVSFIETTLKNMSMPEMIHDVPKEILDIVCRKSRQRVEKENVLYLSGVSSIY